VQSRTNKALAEEIEKKHVRFVYLVPADKEEKAEYKLSIENAARHLQLWYKNQLENNRSFNLYDPIVEVYKTSHNESWYSTNPDADWAGEWKFWFNEVNDAFSLTGGSFDDPNNFWIIYIDALPVCPLLQGGGLSHVAAMGANDLRGLVGQPWIPICDEDVPDYSPCRYVGGLGHELGHAFGLPHPAGCDDGQPVSCDYNAIMYTGYLNYPNTYFSTNEKTTINASEFINEVEINNCGINCTSLVNEYVFSESVDISICQGKSYFAEGSLQTTAGVYTDTFSSKLGCDSVVVTNLKVLPVYQKSVDASICPGGSYFAGGGVQTAAGVYTDTFSSALGCDSVVVTNLKILTAYEKTVDASICPGGSYFAGGGLQAAAGVYTDTFSSALGCDSVVVTNLKVLTAYEETVEASICPGQEYFAGGSLQTIPGVYFDTFSSTLGCDSIVVTKLSLGICTAIETAPDKPVKIYPVPTNGMLYIESDDLHHEELFNSLGKHVLSSKSNSIDFADLPEGYYYLRIFSSPSEFASKKILFLR
jgi:hypothetical protein